ncbi:MAG: DsrE/DsrF/DrsH-like family protein [Zetaproteobacteria bacterium]|nr:DsrE/DsrF/DrsH-like family protein [Zetaproteobacteria bacterium]
MIQEIKSEHKKISIVCFSGDFDKIVAAYTIATGAAATNREVTLFFTFWGLNALKKRQGHSWLGKDFLSRMFNFIMGGRKNLPLSRLNFAGMSPGLMSGMMKKNNVASLEELFEAADALGVRIYACEMAMHILGLKREDLEDSVADVVGVATFLNESEDAHIIFI